MSEASEEPPDPLLCLFNGGQLYMPTDAPPEPTPDWDISSMALAPEEVEPPQMYLLPDGQIAFSNGRNIVPTTISGNNAVIESHTGRWFGDTKCGPPGKDFFICLQFFVNPLSLMGYKCDEADSAGPLFSLLLGTDDEQLDMPSLDDNSEENADINVDDHENELMLEDGASPEESDAALSSLVDVVVTYKCRMCDHYAPSRPELIQHISSQHVSSMADHQGQRPVEGQHLGDQNVGELSSNPACVDPDDPNVLEKMVFLCAQCAEPFDSLEECRSHMVKDHRLVTEEEDMIAKLPLTATSSLIPAPTTPMQILESLPTPNLLLDLPRSSAPDLLPACDVSALTEPISTPILDLPTPVVPPEMPPDPQSVEVDSTTPNENVVVRREQVEILPRIRRKTYLPKELDEFVVSKHVAKRKDSRKFRCDKPDCPSSFETEEELSFHIQCHISKESTFRCFQCRQHFIKWKQCSIHLYRSHKICSGMLNCDKCGHKVSSKQRLVNHKRIHSETREFKCDKCNKTFKQINQLRNHSTIHLQQELGGPNVSRWYTSKECSICHKTYANSKSLKKHVAAVHGNLKPFTCPICGHSSSRKAMLQLHLRQHTGEKPYQCPECDFRTGDHNSLRRHKMRHSGNRPYQCPHCDYAAIQSSTYKAHLLRKHLDQSEGMFECPQCPFLCISEKAFHGHMEDHKRRKKAEESLAKLQHDTFPGNVTAANLVFRCLNTLGPKDGRHISAGIASQHTSEDGNTQTITIQVPASSEPLEDDGCIRVEDLVEQRVVDEPDLGGITIPADPPPTQDTLSNLPSPLPLPLMDVEAVLNFPAVNCNTDLLDCDLSHC